jgi:enoyl-CoA hydratase/carnithine racemase
MVTSYRTVLVERRDEGIAWISMNRPDQLNAMSAELVAELGEALEWAAIDDTIRVVVLTGQGRAFCVGADLGGRSGEGHVEDDAPTAEEARLGFRGPHRLILGLHRMEKPTIAMVNGLAVGGGFDLACACDLRVGSRDSRFMVAYIRIGLFPGYGGTWLYPRALGSVPKAAELLFTGDWLEADEAHRLGLLNRMVDPEDLEGETMGLARRIAAGPPIAIRLSKNLLYRGLEYDLETALMMSASTETITLSSADHQEGLRAFREKRDPIFKGR